MITKIESVFFIALFGFVVAGCSSDDDKNINPQTANEIEQIAQEGTWKITYFFDSDQDETGDFAGYAFSFNNDGTLVADNGDITVTGTWSVDDSSGSDKDFNIFFSVPDDHDFDDLIDDWDIVAVTGSKIELTDVSGGNGGTDYLTFQKI